MSQRSSLVDTLDRIAQEISSEKTAAATPARVKVAGPVPADPGGIDGGSSHPTASADNNGQGAKEGERSSENTADVKSDIGPSSVDSTADISPTEDKQKTLQPNTGTKQSTPGEDPASEDNYKANKDDPGTSHPATAADGEKYSSYTIKQAAEMSAPLGNAILADLANGFGDRLATPASKTAKTAAAAPATPAATAEMQAGYELAAALGLSKEAAAASVQDCLQQTILDAQTDADLVGSYLLAEMKRAADEASAGEDHSKKNDDSSGAGEASSAVASGEPMPGASTPPAPGGEGGGAGGPSEQDALQELAAALDELGIPLEILPQLLAQAHGGGGGAGAPPGAGGGAPPMGGGAPPMDPAAAGGGAPPMDAGGGAPPIDGAKLAADIRAFKMSGKYQFKAAATKQARELRDLFKEQLREYIGR